MTVADQQENKHGGSTTTHGNVVYCVLILAELSISPLKVYGVFALSFFGYKSIL